MKKISKILLMVITVCLMVTTAWAAAASDLADRAGMLEPAQKTQVEQQLQQAAQKHQVRIAIVTDNKDLKVKAGQVANELLDKTYNTGTKGNVVFYINTKTRDWYIATDAKARAAITDEYGINTLGKEVVPPMKEGKYAAACESFLTKTDELLTYYEENGKPMTKDPVNILLLLLGSVAAGAVIAWLYGNHLKKAMSNVIPAAEAGYYMVQDSFDVEDATDIYLYTTFVRAKKEKKNTVSESSADDKHGGGGGKF
ncbi:MAG: TPM domain-containing protein [Megasphaera sp.]|nr:TPM domain-containing protein [Megasphaera sp.]